MALNVYKIGSVAKFLSLATDPVAGENGSLYYNTASGKFRAYLNGGWADITTGSISLTGQALNTSEIVVGNGSNLSAASDTSALGHVLAAVATGLTIKNSVITDAMVAAAAAIARSKIASGTASHVVINDGSGVLSSEAQLAVTRGGTGWNGASLASQDLIIGASSSAFSRLAVGSNDDVLTVSAGNLAYAKIVDANISGSAAIAVAKLAALTANRVIASNGSGVLTPAAFAPGDVILKDGTVAFTGAIDAGSFRVINMAAPVNGSDATTKNYVDNAINGLAWKQAVRAATTADITLSGAQTIDGISLVATERVLVKNQTASADNGIYVVASGAWSRATDADSAAEVLQATVFVMEGTVNADKAFVCTADSPITLGTTSLPFVQISSAGAYSADGYGIELVGSQFQLELDGSSLSKSPTGLRVAAGGISDAHVNAAAAIAYSKLNLASSIVNADVAAGAAIAYSKLNLSASIVNADVASGAAIAYSKLSLSNSIVNADINSAAAIAYSKLNLATSIVNADINAAAAIAYSKLDLASSIVNADVAAGAAIARTKLASGAANRMVVNDGSGVMSDAAAITAARALISDANGIPTHSAVTSTELGYVSGVTSAIQTQLGNKAATDLANVSSIAANLIADANNTRSLGSSGVRWAKLWAVEVDASTKVTTPSIVSASTLDFQGTSFRFTGDGSNFLVMDYQDALTLTANVSTPTAISALSFAKASFNGAVIDYVIKEAGSLKARVGRLIVSHDGTVASSVDLQTETGALGAAAGLQLDAAVNGANIEIRYNNTDASNACTMRCVVKKFRA